MFPIALLLSLTLSLGQTQRAQEIVYLISGASNFGGRPRKPFKEEIKEIVYFTADQFSSISSSFAVAWALPGEPNDFMLVVPMTDDMEQFKNWLNGYMRQSKILKTSNPKQGIVGAFEWLMENVYSKDDYIEKILITFVHVDIPDTERTEFLVDRCRRVYTYMIIFPELNHVCEEKKVRQVVTECNLELNWAKMITHDPAICSKEAKQMNDLGKKIQDAIPTYKRIYQECERKKTTTLPAGTTPCLNSTYCEIATQEPECQSLTCRPWLIALIAGISVGIILSAVIVIKSAIEQFSKPKPEYSLAAALARHHSMMTNQSQVVMSIPKKEEPKKLFFMKWFSRKESEEELGETLRTTRSLSGPIEMVESDTPSNTPYFDHQAVKRSASARDRRKIKRQRAKSSGAIAALIQESGTLAMMDPAPSQRQTRRRSTAAAAGNMRVKMERDDSFLNTTSTPPRKGSSVSRNSSRRRDREQ